MNSRSTQHKLGWILYDFGNSIYHLLLPTILMPLIFRQYLLEAYKAVDLVWAIVVIIPLVFTGALGPLLGARMDLKANHRQILILTTILAAAFASIVPLSGPGTEIFGIISYIASAFFFSISLFVYDSLLPFVASQRNVGKISGLAWGLGYLGGVLALIPVYFVLGKSTLPEDFEAFQHAVWLSCGLYLLFSMSAALLIPRSFAKNMPPSSAEVSALGRVVKTIKAWKENSNFLFCILGYFLVNNALSALVYFTSVYASATLGFSPTTILILFMLVQVVGIPSTILGGHLADVYGHLNVLKVVVCVWIGLCAAFSLAGGMVSFYILSLGTGLVIGTTPSVFRSLVYMFVDKSNTGELYGFTAASNRASGVLGPLVFGAVAFVTGSQRVAMLSLLVFLIPSFLLLVKLKPLSALGHDRHAK